MSTNANSDLVNQISMFARICLVLMSAIARVATSCPQLGIVYLVIDYKL